MTQIAFRSRDTYFETDRNQQIVRYLTEKIEQQQPEKVHHSLIQAYAELYGMMEEVLAENQAIRKMIHAEPEDVKNIIMNDVVQKYHDYLITNYKGEHVALTFDGQVIDHSKSQIDILKKIDNLAIPKTQVFVYSVPLM